MYFWNTSTIIVEEKLRLSKQEGTVQLSGYRYFDNIEVISEFSFDK